jgi:Ca2+/H+ antiporter, TMEM165/GDT1 family
MSLALDPAATLTAVLITILELTEVVVLVLVLGVDQPSVRPGAVGAGTGIAVVSGITLGAGAALATVSVSYLFWAAAIVLAAFGVFLYRSTLRTYRIAAGRGPPRGTQHRHDMAQFAGGFAVGAVEMTEVAIVLLALAAGGAAFSALVGAVVGGLLLVGLAFVLHEQLRRIKVPWLKVLATSVLLSFAVFWGGEAAGVRWPGGDLVLVPLVVVFAALVRGTVGVLVARTPAPPSPA